MPLLSQADDPSEAVLTGVRAIVEGNGVPIAVTGLVIVFVALLAISLFIAALPKLLHAMGPYLPEIASHHDAPAGPSRAAGTTPEGGVDPRLVAAIGWAVHASRKSDS